MVSKLCLFWLMNQKKPLEPQPVGIIAELTNGDVTVFDRYSRWDIYILALAGKLKDIPIHLKPKLQDTIDSCKESL